MALAVTTVLLVLGYVTLRMTALPQVNFLARHYDQIDWLRFVPQPRRLPEGVREPEAEKQRPPTTPATRTTEARPGPQRLDLAAELKNLDLDFSAPVTPVTPTRRAEAAADAPGLVAPALQAGDFDLALTFDASNLDTRLPVRGRAGSGSSAGGEVTLRGGEQVAVGRGLGGAKVEAGLSGPVGRQQADLPAVSVDLKNLQDFGNNFQNFSPLYRPLVEWLRRHPTALPEVVQRFMGYEPGNLTGMVRFTAGGRQFEMYLLCVEATYEVRVCLVEGNEITYLIDEGFKKQSNFLRVGTLVRLPGQQEVHRFGSQLREASDYRTQEFYQIFLSWWDTVREEVKR